MISQIPNHPGFYASTEGRIFTARRNWKGNALRELTQKVRPGNRGGYPDVKMEKGSYRFTVHSLVLSTFRGPRGEGMVGRHLDGNPSNNSIDNLAWGTVKENQSDRHRHGTCSCGDRNGRFISGVSRPKGACS